MLRTVLLVVAGLGAGFAVAMWLQDDAQPFGAEPIATGGAPRPAGFTAGESARLEELEAALQTEIDERAVLEQRVIELGAQLDELRAASPAAVRSAADRRGDAGADADAAREAAREAAVASLPPNARQRFRGGPDTPEQQIERLVAAGFTPDRAAWIQQRTAQLTLERMQAQYTARREGQPMPAALADGEQTLRSELGEQDYERYLNATGRPTRVGVYNVLPGSPGERSGLKPGDEIVSYAGQRVFDVGDLNELTFEGNPGESVVVDVVRDGQQMQLVVPRGPIGIGGGPFRRGP
jgi:PDZ domain-containing protein